MPVARQITTSRSLLVFSTGILVGFVFSGAVKRSGSGDRMVFKEPLQPTALTRRSFDNGSSIGNYAHARPCTPGVSRLSFPLEGVPSPRESALRFAAANEAGSDKVSLHSYHLMYGPFLAPYLHKNVVSVSNSS